MKTKTDKDKITVKVLGPLLKKLNEMTTAACLNRDAYLDIVFAHEARMLVNELEGKRNSDEAKQFIKRSFAELGKPQQVSFRLSHTTAMALTDACEQVNVRRDVFVNRVIFFLIASARTVEAELEIQFNDQARQAIFDEGWDVKALLLGPRLAAVRQFITDDPFLGIRAAHQDTYPEGGGALHAVTLGIPLADTVRGRGFAGLNAYLDDIDVPGTKARESLPSADDLAAAMLAAAHDDQDARGGRQ